MKSQTPQPLAPALAERIRSSRRRYGRRLEQCQRKFSETAVHQLRVATRRMLAVTDLLEAVRIGKNPAKLRRAFKQRLDDFGPLRDTQVQRRLLGGLARRFTIASQLERRLARRERRLVRVLRRQVKALRHRRLDRWLKRAEKDLKHLGSDARALQPRVATALNTSFKTVTALQQKVRPDRLATVHRLRIAFKQHRYLCELLHPLWPPLVKVDLNAMHRFQTLMGDIQDCEVMLTGIRDAVEAADVAANASATLKMAVLARRTRRTKTFLENLERLRGFRPSA